LPGSEGRKMAGLVNDMLDTRKREDNRYGIPPDEVLASLPWGDLLTLRKRFDGDKAAQNRLAPYEHRAFARELVEEQPVTGTIGQGVLIPFYTLSKLLGLEKSRSDPSWEEIRQGFAGIGDGWARTTTGTIRDLPDEVPPR